MAHLSERPDAGPAPGVAASPPGQSGQPANGEAAAPRHGPVSPEFTEECGVRATGPEAPLGVQEVSAITGDGGGNGGGGG